MATAERVSSANSSPAGLGLLLRPPENHPSDPYSAIAQKALTAQAEATAAAANPLENSEISLSWEVLSPNPDTIQGTTEQFFGWRETNGNESDSEWVEVTAADLAAVEQAQTSPDASSSTSTLEKPDSAMTEVSQTSPAAAAAAASQATSESHQFLFTGIFTDLNTFLTDPKPLTEEDVAFIQNVFKSLHTTITAARNAPKHEKEALLQQIFEALKTAQQLSVISGFETPHEDFLSLDNTILAAMGPQYLIIKHIFIALAKTGMISKIIAQAHTLEKQLKDLALTAFSLALAQNGKIASIVVTAKALDKELQQSTLDKAFSMLKRAVMDGQNPKAMLEKISSNLKAAFTHARQIPDLGLRDTILDWLGNFEQKTGLLSPFES